jgi:hypothetical protein
MLCAVDGCNARDPLHKRSPSSKDIGSSERSAFLAEQLERLFLHFCWMNSTVRYAALYFTSAHPMEDRVEYALLVG